VPQQAGKNHVDGQFFAKGPDGRADLQITKLMKFLVSAMPELNRRILEKAVQTRNSASAPDAVIKETPEARKMTVCHAVEDRICKRIDLTSRRDLTEREVMAALCLLLKIVRITGWPFRFSTAEFLLLMRGREAASGSPWVDGSIRKRTRGITGNLSKARRFVS
jgi:hypothetical protein